MADLVFSVPDVVVADIWFVAALDVIQLPTLSDWLTRREAWRSILKVGRNAILNYEPLAIGRFKYPTV